MLHGNESLPNLMQKRYICTANEKVMKRIIVVLDLPGGSNMYLYFHFVNPPSSMERGCEVCLDL